MSESRTKKSVKNVSVTFAARIITLILGLISRKIFLIFLTKEYLGLNGLFSNVLTILSFAELGIGNVIQYSLYKPVKEGESELIKTLMNFYKKAYRVIAVSVLVLSVLILPFLNYIIGEKPDIPENITLIYFMFILNTAVSYLFSYKQTLLSADQNAYIITMFNSIFAILLNVVHILVLFLTKNFIIYLASTICGTILNNYIISRYVDKKYPYIKGKCIQKMPKTEKKNIFRDVKALSISKIAGVACNGTDNIIITKILGLGSVGLASNYTLIINTVSGMLYAMLSSMTGSVGNLNTEDDIQKRQKIFDQLFLLSYLLYGCIGGCILVLINFFIGKVWLGAEYVAGFHTALSLVLIAFQSGMNFTAYTFRTTLGYFDEVKYVYVATAILNIALSIVFGKWLGLPGVFYATTISKLLTSEIADGYYAYKMGLHKKPILYFIRYLLYCLLFAGNTFLCNTVVGIIPLYGAFGFIVKGIVCFMLVNVINIGALAWKPEFKDLYNRLGQLILKKYKKGEKLHETV